MTPPDAHDDRLDDLRRRWEEEPGSRLFLQLAEEYRHRDRHAEALEVLEKGLEAHPQQVSGLVALGRLRLEMEQPREAARALEKALNIDATNAVAMKLAVEAYLQQGERDQARQRLELYKLLNATDPEIEGLEDRLAGRSPAVGAGPDRDDSSQPLPADGEVVNGPIGAPDVAPEEEPTEDGTPRRGAEAPPENEDRTVPWRESASGWSPTAAWPGLPRGAAPSSGPASGEAVTGEDPAAAPARSAVADATLPDGQAEEDAQSPPVDTRPDPFDGLEEAGQRRRYLQALGAEGIFPVEVEPETEAVSVPQAGVGEPPADVPAKPAAGEPRAPLAGAPPADRPTVTLGQLYLDQGHAGEALRIFEAVLQRDPENDQARTGLLRAQSSLADEPSRIREAEEPTGREKAHAGPGPTGEPTDGSGARADSAAAAARLEDAVRRVEPSAGGLEPDNSGAELVATPDDAAAGLPFGLEPEESSARPAEAPSPPVRPAQPRSLTAAELLTGADPDQPPKQALLHAYLARLRGRGPS